MRTLKHECWFSCDACERQLPTLDANALLRLGWFVNAARHVHLCPACAQKVERSGYVEAQ